MDNPETNVPVSPPAEAPKSPKKAKKVDVQTFFANWGEVLASDRDPLPRLRSMVKVGFQGEVNAERLSQLRRSLSEHRVVAERLALPLAVQERFGKLKPLARRLLDELRTTFEREMSYDRRDFSGYRAPRTIEDWVAEHAPLTPASERDSWFRRFTTCVLKDSEPKTLLVALVAASRRWALSKGLKSSGEEATFVRGIAVALGAPSVSSNKLELILAGVDALDDQFRRMLNRELDLERQIRSQQDAIDDVKRQLAELEGRLSEAHTEGEQKAARIAELERSAAEAEERYSLLDRHWRSVSEQELTKQSGTFRERVSQEVVEALLALDRDNPSIEIALRRLHRIQEILAK
jgi:hypothetical protein